VEEMIENSDDDVQPLFEMLNEKQSLQTEAQEEHHDR